MPKNKFSVAWVDIGIKRDASVCVTVFKDDDEKTRIAENKSWSPQILKWGDCPLINPGGGYFCLACHQCSHFEQALQLFIKTENVDTKNVLLFMLHDRFEKYLMKVGGYSVTGMTMYV
jgi:hypothetical protein